MRTCLTPLFILLLCIPQFYGTGACVRAQETLDSNSVLQLLTKPLGDAIALRWAPADYETWRRMQIHGVIVERRRLGDRTGFKPIGERIQSYSLADFKGLADTNNVHVIAVAEALHGESAPGTRPGELGAVLDASEEQQQRLFLAYVNADLSAEAAKCLGWSLVDKAVTPGTPYEYRLRLPDPEREQFSAPVRRRCNDHYDDTSPTEFRLVPGTEKITLTWSLMDAERFGAYHLERSADGQQWERPLGVPLWQEPGEEEFAYEIELPEGTPTYSYRLRGIDAFGWVSPPTEALKAETIDRTGPAPPTTLRGEGLPDGIHRLKWTPAQPASPDLAGYRVLRGPGIDGPYNAITTALLPASATEYNDTAPLVGKTSFYVVEAVDRAGNAVRSPANFVRPHDDTPPVKPTGLTGRIDTLGRVFLLWKPGQEPDLLGYRVYRSHARDREFLQVTEAVQHKNFFFDSTTLLVLDEEILYKIVAVDRHYNPSPYSEILELRRPDKVAPSAPALTGYSAGGTQVEIRWQPSGSRDVVRQTVWRARGEQPARPLAAIGPMESSYLDTSTVARTTYTYTVRSEDEVGLFGTSFPLTVRSGGVSGRSGVTLTRARTQVRGEDEEVLRWPSPTDEASGYQLYGGASDAAMRPLRKLPPDQREWPVSNPGSFYAIRVIYAGGGRSPLSNVVAPTKR